MRLFDEYKPVLNDEYCYKFNFFHSLKGSPLAWFVFLILLVLAIVWGVYTPRKIENQAIQKFEQQNEITNDQYTALMQKIETLKASLFAVGVSQSEFDTQTTPFMTALSRLKPVTTNDIKTAFDAIQKEKMKEAIPDIITVYNNATGAVKHANELNQAAFKIIGNDLDKMTSYFNKLAKFYQDPTLKSQVTQKAISNFESGMDQMNSFNQSLLRNVSLDVKNKRNSVFFVVSNEDKNGFFNLGNEQSTLQNSIK
jgi:hypothetical protein